MSSYTESKSSYIEGDVGQARWRRGFADLKYRLNPRPKWDMDFDLTYTRATLDASQYIPSKEFFPDRIDPLPGKS
jgi:hypothetical protein